MSEKPIIISDVELEIRKTLLKRIALLEQELTEMTESNSMWKQERDAWKAQALALENALRVAELKLKTQGCSGYDDVTEALAQFEAFKKDME